MCYQNSSKNEKGDRMEIDKVRKYFYKDRYLSMTGVEIDEAGDDKAICSMTISDIHMNASNHVQGGATYTLADSAFAVASNIGHLEKDENKITVGQSASISYLKPPKGKKLIANARKISGGKRISVFSIEIKDELGTDVAIFTGNAYTIQL